MISVIIPVRAGGNPYITLQSLAYQSLQPDEIIVSWDEGHGANWARNRGFEKSKGDLVLFSDDDIEWKSDAVQRMAAIFDKYKAATFAFGSYTMGGKEYCDRPFTYDRLRENSCVSTMTMIRRDAFPMFDESIRRLQDWDLFLTVIEKTELVVGFHVGNIFATDVRPGISFAPDAQDWKEARDIVARKHGLI